MSRAKNPPIAIDNRLLARLSSEDYQRLLPDLEPIELSLGDVVYETNTRQDYLYFPTTAVMSLISAMKDGAATEVGVVGSEGVVGIAVFMGGEQVPNQAVVQIAGDATRMKADILQKEFKRGGKLQFLLLRYTQSLIAQISQTAACNRRHSAEQRLCRWFLLCADRVKSSEFMMTQEFIATMLGARRESVNSAAGELQAAGLIQYSRGHVKIIDRKGLEARVCECYQVVKNEFDRLFGKGGAAG